jgi:hypothetical protein
MSGFLLGTVICAAFFGIVYLVTQQIRNKDTDHKTAH